MKICFNIICFLLCVQSLTFANAGTGVDSVSLAFKNGWVRKASASDIMESDSVRYMPLTHQLDGVQVFNPIMSPNGYVAFLGNFGSAYRYLAYQAYQPVQFDIGIHQLDSYTIIPGDIQYYRTRKRFTDLKYILGVNSEQMLDLLHTQNINSRLNAGFQIRRMVTDGYINHQITYSSNFNVFTSYFSKSKRYRLLGNVYYNRLRQDENGGLTSDSLFEKSNELPINAIVHLTSVQARWEQRGIQLQQAFDSRRDSAALANKSSFWRVAHLFQFDRKGFAYQDVAANKNPFYEQVYDTLKTIDTTGFNSLTNAISVANISRFNLVKLGITHQYLQVNSGDIQHNYHNITTQGKWNWHSAFFAGDINMEYGLYGYNAGDRVVSASVLYHLPTSNSLIKAEVMDQQHKPSWEQVFLYSNYFRWDHLNDFVPVHTTSQAVSFYKQDWNFQLTFRNNRIEHLIGFDESARPVQGQGSTQIQQLEIQKDFKTKHFCVLNRVMLQNIVGDDFLKLPKWMSYHSVYLQGNAFKNALHWQSGIDLYYHAGYYGLQYMPVTGQFYVQNNKQIGNYPTVNFFVNLQIKSARIFFKLEQVNNGLAPKGTNYLLPHYPQQAMAFKTGISWRFLD